MCSCLPFLLVWSACVAESNYLLVGDVVLRDFSVRHLRPSDLRVALGILLLVSQMWAKNGGINT